MIITIWNDPRGCYAFIRDNKRYGHYIEPKDESGLYYKRLNGDTSENTSKMNTEMLRLQGFGRHPEVAPERL